MIIGILDRNYCQFSLQLLLCNWEIDARCILSCDWMSPTWSRLSKRGNLTCRTVKNFHMELPCMEHLSLQARYKTAKNIEYSTEVLHKKFQWMHKHKQTLKVALDEGQMTGSILRFCDCHHHCIVATKLKKSTLNFYEIDNFRPKLQIKVANKGQSCRSANKRVYCLENLFATFAHPWL